MDSWPFLTNGQQICSSASLHPLSPGFREDHIINPARNISRHNAILSVRQTTLSSSSPALSKAEESLLRRIQTNTFPHPVRLHSIFPNQYSAECQFCSQPGTLLHIIIQCGRNPKLPPLRSPLPTLELRENLVTSGHLDVQQQLLASRAKSFCSPPGFPD